MNWFLVLLILFVVIGIIIAKYGVPMAGIKTSTPLEDLDKGNIDITKCNKMMCELGIYTASEYKQWLISNHPDKFLDPVEKERATKYFAEHSPQLLPCNTEKEYAHTTCESPHFSSK